MKKLTLLFAIIVLMVSSSAFAQKTWTGATSTAWNTAGNWSPSGVPTAAQNVTIPVTANQPLISGTTTPVCNNLTVNSGALLTISATSASNAQLTVAGTATFNGGLSIGGILAKTGKIVTTNIVWNSTATLSAFLNARCEVSGNWTFSSGSSIDMGWCWVTLTGTGNSTITNNSANSKFSSLTLGKSATATTTIGAASSATLTITGGLIINANNTMNCAANITTVVQGNIVSNGYFKFDYGTVSLERASGTQELQLATTGNYFKSLKINCGGTVTLNNSLAIQGNLTIQAGTFNPQNNTLYVTGNWINTAGPAYFTEGTGKVVFDVIINKDGGRDYDNIIQNSENFNILELNNAYGDLIINSGLVVVTCNKYDWVAGGLNVSQGVFTALDLVDNGLFGRYYVSGTGTINLTNDDGYVDLNGSTINISGGTFNVYGGTTDSYWPFSQNASLTMSGGIFNFAETGILVSASTTTLTSNITGGTIKTAKNFNNSRSDFNPAGGTIELYGPTDASLYCVGTASLYGVKINKTASKDGENTTIIYPRIDRETGEVLSDDTRAQIVNLTSPITFNGNFVLTSGTFNSNSHTIQAKRDWTNNAGAGSFNPGTGRVIFNGGNYHQVCYNETFNILELNKVSGGAFRLSSGTTVTCAVYDWTAGSIDVLANGGTFTALDLFDNGIFGGYYVNPGGTINLYQDVSQYVDLCGNITFTGGGTINVYGGSSTSFWPYNSNASITMNAGVLDFKNQGILVTTSAHTLTSNITAGTIRTVGAFTCNRSDFNPTGGAIELYGTQNASLSMAAGTLYNLTINKSVANNVSLSTNVVLTGGLTIDSGTLNMNAKTLTTSGSSTVNNGGILDLNAGSSLLIASSRTLNINSGGLLKTLGVAGTPALISRNGASGYFNININSGGTISARNAQFHYVNPLRILSGGTIDATNPFDNCQFRYCTTGMLMVDNAQTLLIRNTEFLTPATGYNVYKTANSGELTFKDAFGNYSGASYENDPYNRIQWTITQPGLWTGAVSTNWNTAGNWDDGIVPTAAVNVTIPSTAPNMPVIATHCQLNNLTLNGTLTINGAIATVNGNASISGNLTLNYEGSWFVVMGDLTWNAGSTANHNDIDTEIDVYGNFTFNTGSNVQLNNGGVKFRGSANKNIINHSANSWFYNLVSAKTSGAAIDFAATSTQPLKVTGTLSTETGAKFKASSGLNIDLKNNLVSYGTFEIEWSRIVFSGTDHYIQPNVNDYFYHLNFNQSGTVTINTSNSNVLQVRGGIAIISGVFNAGSSTIKVQSGWANFVGPGAFIAGSSRVIFEGFMISDIYNNENFNILEINKSAGNVMVNGTTVTCNSFDWTNGQLRTANGGVFTAYDLADDGIFADIELQSGSTINLYQDIYQRVDLGGKLWIMGGSTVNVFGGNGWSQWPYGANATLYMTDGTLDFKDQGINVNALSPNTLTLDLTGGIIRTPVGFFCNRPDFDPEPATLEIYGDGNSTIDLQSGQIWDININKSGTEDEVLINSDLIANSVIVNSGVLKSTPNSNLIFKDAYAYDNGTIWLTEGTDIKLTDSYEFAANGGKFMLMGEPDNYVSVGRQGTNYANLYVGNGGNISARYTHFSDFSGALIMNDGIVNPDHAFTGCTFENSFYSLMQIDNNQDLTIQNAHFPTASAPYNVTKYLNQGSVTFVNATGAFAGEAFEDDPYNRIHWVIPQPGLWTGAVSTDWHTAGNWDDLLVPTSSTNVTIPTDAVRMPVISNSFADCDQLTLLGTLTIQNKELSVAGSADIGGNLTMNHYLGALSVQGNINWNSGSTATISSGYIRVYGNWNFNEGSNAQLAMGGVQLKGEESNSITVNSENASFNDLYIEKEDGGLITFNPASTSPIRSNGFYVSMGAAFTSDCAQDIIVTGNFYSFGNLTLNDGSVVFNGADHLIIPNVDNYYNNLVFNQTGTVTINQTNTDTLIIKGDLTINSGIFSPETSTLKLKGSWINNFGPDAFDEGNSRVIFNRVGGQFCSSEDFNILEIDKPIDLLYNYPETTITCEVYDWTSGGIWISPGNFSAASLADDGLYGTFAIFSGTMELHQNVSKSVDLIGEIIVGYDATLNVYGGNGMSEWGHTANAIVTMGYGTGVLDFKNSGINIADQAPYQFTGNIFAGTIKTIGSFFSTSPGFNPAGGIVELYGSDNSLVSLSEESSFYDLHVRKTADYTGRVNMNSMTIRNNLIIYQGLSEPLPEKVVTANNIIVENGGWLTNNSATMRMASLKVKTGGYITIEGTDFIKSVFDSRNPAEKYELIVENGADVLVRNAVFMNMNEQGVYIAPGANINPYLSFMNCEFLNGAPGPYPLLSIDTDQDLIIENAVFPTNTWGGQYNVRKIFDSGSVTFINAIGDFAGEANDDDPFNRIHWIIPQPGLWTGAVSTDWHTAGNWDDGNVPTEGTNVLIPADRMFMPVISSETAYCNDLTLNGTLTLSDANIVIFGNMIVSGHLETINEVDINIEGDVEWNEGSTASINIFTIFYVYGNWQFNAGADVQITGGTVFLLGSNTKTLINHSQGSQLSSLFIYKTEGAFVEIPAESDQTIIIGGTLRIDFGSQLIINSDQDINIGVHFYNDGNLQSNAGTIRFTGNNVNIYSSPIDFFNNVIFDHTGTATFDENLSELNVHGDLTINSGVFIPGNNTIKLRGSWYNNAGPDHFSEGNSRVIFNGSTPQFCSTEEFYILEIDKTLHYFYDKSESNIFCQIYDWTQGGMWIAGGSTFHAADLADDGIYGDFVLWSNSIELHQDALQSIDLHGSISINGGEFRVYGGKDHSLWGTNANANLFMGSGVLDFVDKGIKIQDAAPYSFTSTISGGTIRTQNGFIVQSPGFDPMGGTVELYGPQNSAILSTEGGAFYNVTINKPSDFSTRATIWNSIVKNSFVVAEGLAEVGFGHELECWTNLEVQDGGWMAVNSATLSMKYLSSVNVYDNGALSIFGYEGAMSRVKGILPTEPYTFSINSGGTLEATFTIFETLPEQGVYIAPGGIVNPAYSFTNCEFRNGMSGPTTLMSIDSDQDIIIENAVFPTNTWGGQYNVRKIFDSGSVTFINATGDFAGEANEDDPYNRIHWITSVPGLWTGAVSTDWFTAGNWSDGNVPTEETNVLIPADRMFMPVISSETAYCNNLTLNGTLTLNDANIVILGNLVVSGHLETINEVDINIEGDVEWNEGATASIHIYTTFYVYGNWQFNAGAEVQITGGTVFLLGSNTKTLINHSQGSQLRTLFIYKTEGAFVEIPAESDQTLIISGTLRIDVGSQLIINSDQDIDIGAHLYNDGNLQSNSGTIRFTGNNISINCGLDDIFNNVIFDHTGTATLIENFSELNIHGDLTINSGVFNPGDNTIKLWGSWINNAGPGAFNKAQSRVMFTGAGGQFCSSEDFNILEIDKALQYLYLQNEDVITCDSYDNTNGGLWIAGNATFIANDLADDGLYGNLHLFEGYVELHQDDSQSVDLRGELVVSGGAMKVFGGNDISRWGMYAGGHLTMSGGVLDFGEIGINIVENYGFDFSSNITGGVIRTMRIFWAQSESFSPAGGVVEIYGNMSATVLTEMGGSLWDLHINKPEDFSSKVSMYSTIVANELVVEKGLCELFPTYTFEIGSILVKNGGWLGNGGAIVHLSGLVVNSGGVLTSEGYDDVRCIYTSLNPGEKYSFMIENGGHILVRNSLFENMDENGIYIAAGATVNNYQPFINCEFRNGVEGAYPLLVINNDQDFIIENAVFPTNTWGGHYNVRKHTDQGNVTFVNYSGDFGGSTFEDDPFGRIHWQNYVPGLWTGLISDDWNTAGNWGNMEVPDEFTNVTIPATAPNMPEVNSPDANCRNLTIDTGANLGIGSGKLKVTNRFEIFGNLTMIDPAGELEAYQLWWSSGSTDNITVGQIKVNTWYFAEGTLAKLGPGNTATITSGISVYEPEAEFGSLVMSTFGKSDNGKSTYTLRVSGNCLLKTGSHWSVGIDMQIAGNFTIEMGSGLTAPNDDLKISVGNNLNLGGYLSDFDEIIVDGNFDLQQSGELRLAGGTFTCNYETEDWIELSGKLIMSENADFRINGANVRIGESFDATESLAGELSFGKSFEAIHPNTFQPGYIWINFINNYSGHTINVSNSNYLPSVYIERTGCELTLANDLQIDGEVRLLNGTLITDGNKLMVADEFSIRNDSKLTLTPGTELTLGNSMKIFDGGVFESLGDVNNFNIVINDYDYGGSKITSGFMAYNGGTISAEYTNFMINNYTKGIEVESSGLVHLTHSFHHCSFTTESAQVTLLSIENNQELVINNAQFPDYVPGGYNMAKLNFGGSVTFNNATGDFAGSLYENDTFSQIHWETTFFSQPISIPAGWSGISSYVIPNQPAMEDVFAPIADELIIAQTMTEMYYPGQNINTIGNWISHSAYKVKTNAACLLEITGENETNLAVQLNTGWNLLPVVSPDGADPDDLFVPVSGFVMAKDVAGTGVYWPQYNINSLGYVLPGKTYFVLMTAPGMVDYTGMKSSGTLTGFKNLSGLGYNIQPTPSTHTIAILPSAIEDFEPETIIGAYDQDGNCFGITEIGEGNNYITIFGDDPTTAEKDGFIEGEVMLFKTLTGFETLSGLFDPQLPNADGLFTENGLSAITGFESSTGISFDNILSNVNIYPNPSDGVMNFSGLVDGTKITIADVRGQVVLETETHNSDLFTLDLSGSNPGVYFVNIQYNGHNIFRKIVLR